MKELTSLSMWLILTAIIPGFFTIGILYLVSYLLLGHSFFICIKSEWILMGIFIVIMIITQMFGLCFEKCYVSKYVFYKARKNKLNKKGKDALKGIRNYKNMYKTLIKIDNNNGTDKHLERICGQFFMSCNMEASLLFGIIATISCYIHSIKCHIYVQSLTCTFIIILITLIFLMFINFSCVIESRWRNLTVSICEYNKLLK